MDPLSVTASIIAVLTAASAVLKTLEGIKARGSSSPDLVTLMNAERVKKAQKSIYQLVDFAAQNLAKPTRRPRLLELSAKKRKELVDIKDAISENHRNLQVILLATNLQQTFIIRKTILVQHGHQVGSLTTMEQALNTISAAQSTTTATEDTSTAIVSNGQLQAPNSGSTSPGPTSGVVQRVQDNTELRVATKRTNFYHCTYHFPVWLLRSALVYTSWNNLSGTNASWALHMPRYVTNDHLWIHIKKGSISEVKKLLAERVISPYDVEKSGISILQWAVLKRKVAISALLAAEGADWHWKDKSGDDKKGRTALHYAALKGCIECMRALLEAGADPHRKSFRRHTPLHKIHLQENGSQKHIESEIATLLRYGADLEARNRFGRTPLHLAVQNKHSETVAGLANHGANVNTLDHRRNAPLHSAIYYNNIEIIKILAAYGAEPSWNTSCGIQTVVEAAAQFGSVEMMNALATSQFPPVFRDPACIFKIFEEDRDRLFVGGAVVKEDEEAEEEERKKEKEKEKEEGEKEKEKKERKEKEKGRKKEKKKERKKEKEKERKKEKEKEDAKEEEDIFPNTLEDLSREPIT
ncbi:ankyrin [Bimuria novae-zelandiae CBS 107.79]|uniref:Ankyrin n=1 Tax=Bimuria novae-zelandiae CBS 107.79 TaxID=1447943 RepID=A0A6A5UVE6_9PLEO|nr:ankyrin [Bimuria novae-zelandiae CBS 107.79]